MPDVYSDKLKKFAEAIKSYEGFSGPSKRYPQGTRSYRNLNPGNFRYTSLVKELGAVGKDKDGYAIFESDQEGFDALCEFILMACTNKLKAYRGTMTIGDFFLKYAPSNDGNYPAKYTKYVCLKIKVSVTDPIKTLL